MFTPVAGLGLGLWVRWVKASGTDLGEDEAIFRKALVLCFVMFFFLIFFVQWYGRGCRGAL